MSDELETVKVANADAPGGYVVINASDFDDKVHTLYTEPAATAEEEPEKPKKGQK